MPDTGVFDGIHIVIEGGPNVTRPLKHDNKITVGNLTPGTEYNFFVSIISGTKLSNMYYVPAVKTCKYFGTYIRFFFFNFDFVSHFILVGYIHFNAVVFKDLLKIITNTLLLNLIFHCSSIQIELTLCKIEKS